MSPVASPQNLIALMAIQTATHGDVAISFGEWVQLAVPFCVVMTLLIWAFIMFVYRKELPPAMPSLRRSVRH
eukprot:COSAG01_NODE_2875_length_6937_cov_2.860924_6_plen_72_part_00